MAKLLAEKTGIKGYKSTSADTLLSALTLPKSVKKSKKAKINFSNFSKARKE